MNADPVSLLADMFQQVERNDIRVADVVVTHRLCGTLLKHNRFKDVFDQEAKTANVQKGLAGMIWGANLWVVPGFPPRCLDKATGQFPDVKVYGEFGFDLAEDFPGIVAAKESLE